MNFNRNCCRNTSRCCGSGEPFFCPRLRSYVIRGPRGATGETGPQGPRGLPGAIVDFGSFSTPNNVLVASGSDIPFEVNVVLSGTNIQHAQGATSITLNSGTYMINWSTDAIIPASGNVSVALTVGGTVNGNSRSVIMGAVGNRVSLNSAIILTFGTSNVLTLRNIGAQTTFQNVSFTIVKIA
ncbi:MAG: collagen-like protein [Clostridia bacterium]|nr:collagen-like protein [Clostridia bacterium]